MAPLNESKAEQVTLTWLRSLGYMICQARATELVLEQA